MSLNLNGMHGEKFSRRLVRVIDGNRQHAHHRLGCPAADLVEQKAKPSQSPKQQRFKCKECRRVYIYWRAGA